MHNRHFELGASGSFHEQSSQMHLAHLRLRDFRNYGRLDADFAPGFHLLLGDNAQGKTNILEAIYLVATLRSFRGLQRSNGAAWAARAISLAATSSARVTTKPGCTGRAANAASASTDDPCAGLPITSVFSAPWSSAPKICN